jgi:hypothetical protein
METQVYITCREFEIKTRHLAISLEKPKYKAKEIFKTCELFNIGDVYYILN